jgi:hypothetical protein
MELPDYIIHCTTYAGKVHVLENFKPRLSFMGWSKLKNFLASSPSVLVICLDSTKLMVESVLNEGYEHSCLHCCDLLRQAYNSLGFF